MGSEASRDACLELGIVDSAHLDAAACVRDADLVVLCSHLGSYTDIAKTIAPALKPGAIVTDVGSVKACVLAELRPLLPGGIHLVPGHPVSGAETSGPRAGFAELFDNRWCILTPDADTDQAAVDRVAAFWRAIGSRVEIMDAEHHDLVLAVTSHLPHLIAYSIVGTASRLEDVTKGEVIKYSAGGFRDFTRIASSEPEFWRDVFLANKGAVLEVLGRFTEDLTTLQQAIRGDDGDQLFELFSKSRDVRQRIIDAGQESPAPDFGRRQGPGEL